MFIVTLNVCSKSKSLIVYKLDIEDLEEFDIGQNYQKSKEANSGT